MNESVRILVESILNKMLEEAKFDRISASNPDFSLALNHFKDVNPKYLDWILNQIKGAQLTNEKAKEFGDEVLLTSLEYISDTLAEFDKLVNKGFIRKQDKDIGQYKDISYVNSTIQDALDAKEASDEKKRSKSEKEVLFDDETYLVMVPQSLGASCYYGKGTKWCISAKEQNMYNDYSMRGWKFVFAINKKTGDKDALAYSPETIKRYGDTGIEIYDAQDKRVSIEDYKKKYPTISDMVFKYIEFNNDHQVVHYSKGEAGEEVKVFTTEIDKDDTAYVYLGAPHNETFRIENKDGRTEVHVRPHNETEEQRITPDSLTTAMASHLDDNEYDRVKALIHDLLGFPALSTDAIY